MLSVSFLFSILYYFFLIIKKKTNFNTKSEHSQGKVLEVLRFCLVKKAKSVLFLKEKKNLIRSKARKRLLKCDCFH